MRSRHTPRATKATPTVFAAVVLAAACLLMAQSAQAQYASVQAAFASRLSGAAYVFPNNNVAGDAIVVAASWGGTATPSISDTRGNSYTLATVQTNGRFSVGVWVAFRIAGGANAVTLTLPGQRFDATYIEYAGLASLDRVAGASGTNLAPSSSATPATTSANEMVFGFASRNYPTLIAGAGFTARASGAWNRSVMAEDRRVTATGAQTATFAGTGGLWIAVAVTFAEARGTRDPTVVNPYAGGTARKAQLHAHSRVSGRTTPCPVGDTGGSDGATGEDTCPSQRASAYRAAGYSVVSLTDHDMRSGIAGCTWVDNQCMLDGVLYLAGSEQTVTTVSPANAHMVSVAIGENRGNRAPFPVETAQQTLNGSISDGGLAFLAHPATTGLGWPWNVVSSLVGVEAIEIASAFPYRGDALWDRMLGNRDRAYGVAADDTHLTRDFNKAWTVVNTPALTKQAVVESLKSGNSYAVRCYAGTCLDLTSISVSGPTIVAHSNQSARYVWIGYREGYASESGTNMVLDSAHATNRRVSISGRPFTSADVNRLLYVMSYTRGYWVRTGTYVVTGINGSAAVLDRPVASSGMTNVWWELGGGWALRTATGTSDSYTVTGSPARGDHIYVRLYGVLDHNREFWSQPFFVQ